MRLETTSNFKGPRNVTLTLFQGERLSLLPRREGKDEGRIFDIARGAHDPLWSRRSKASPLTLILFSRGEAENTGPPPLQFQVNSCSTISVIRVIRGSDLSSRD